MQLNPAEISALIKERIQGFESSAQIRTQGSVVSVTDGICRVYGLSEAMQGEMLEFPGNVFGLETPAFHLASPRISRRRGKCRRLPTQRCLGCESRRWIQILESALDQCANFSGIELHKVD